MVKQLTGNHMIGIDYALSYDDYAAFPGVSATALKIAYMHSMAHVRAYMDGTFEKRSAALDFGKAFHSLALEGKEDFIQHPASYTNEKGEVKKWSGNAAVCKEWLRENPGYVVDEDEETSLRAMQKAVEPHLIFKSKFEVSIFSELEGLPVKCRLDMLTDGDDDPIIDLKTCADANPEKFMREALRLGYHLQAAWALDVLRLAGIKREEFRFVAVESKPPHGVCVLRFLDQEVSLLRVGRIRYKEQLRKLKQAIEKNDWPSYGTVWAEEFAPAWMKRELELT